MPYIDGKRVSLEEWQDRFSSLKKMYTGPNGENPAPDPTIDETTGAPEAKPSRSPRSAAAAKAAIAETLGVAADSEAMSAIDVTNMDAGNADAPDEEASAPESFVCDQCGMVAKSAFGLAAHKRAKHKE